MHRLAEQVDIDALPEFRSPTARDPQLAQQLGRAFEALMMPAARLERELCTLEPAFASRSEKQLIACARMMPT